MSQGDMSLGQKFMAGLPIDLVPEGCWVAYYHDRSAYTVFFDELSALRHAVEASKVVKFVKWGEDL